MPLDRLSSYSQDRSSFSFSPGKEKGLDEGANKLPKDVLEALEEDPDKALELIKSQKKEKGEDETAFLLAKYIKLMRFNFSVDKFIHLFKKDKKEAKEKTAEEKTQSAEKKNQSVDIKSQLAEKSPFALLSQLAKRSSDLQESSGQMAKGGLKSLQQFLTKLQSALSDGAGKLGKTLQSFLEMTSVPFLTIKEAMGSLLEKWGQAASNFGNQVSHFVKGTIHQINRLVLDPSTQILQSLLKPMENVSAFFNHMGHKATEFTQSAEQFLTKMTSGPLEAMQHMGLKLKESLGIGIERIREFSEAASEGLKQGAKRIIEVGTSLHEHASKVIDRSFQTVTAIALPIAIPVINLATIAFQFGIKGSEYSLQTLKKGFSKAKDKISFAVKLVKRVVIAVGAPVYEALKRAAEAITSWLLKWLLFLFKLISKWLQKLGRPLFFSFKLVFAKIKDRFSS